MREVALQVDSNARAPKISRSHLASIKESLEPLYEDVVLLVSELVTNSVRHSDSESIDVSVQAINGPIRIEVSDEGPGFDPSHPRGEGLGLTIVEKLSDKWGLKRGDRFTVWAELSRPSQ